MAVLDKLKDFWGFLPFARAEEKREPPVVIQPELFANERELADNYQIQPLTLAHLDELWQLDRRCFVNGEAYSRETLEFLLGEPNGLSYRAVLASGAMIAFVIAMLEKDGSGHITTIGVAPEFRRHGLAYQLLEKAEASFQKKGVGMMRLEVRTANTGAQKLYERAGYVVTQRLARYYANGGDGLLMVKALN